MDWFSGGVPGAIAASRTHKALFIVYVYDESTASSTTTEAWNSPLVQGALSGNQVVAIKIAKGSLEHQQFCQIYPVFIFPSVFCIGLTGKTLTIMNGPQTSSELQEKLNEAFQKLQEELKPAAPPQATPTTQPEAPPTKSETPPTQSETQPTQAEGSGASLPPPSQPLLEEKESASSGGGGAEGGAQSATPTGGHEGSEGRGQSATMSRQESREEKLERAQQKIRQRRREKEEAEFEKQKMAELKRREEGRELGESKKNLDDLRRQTWLQERKKAKEEEKAAREAILAKLRQDKLEREAGKRAREQQLTDGVVKHRSVPSTSSPTSSFTSTGLCRIQLRLPSGEKSVLEMRAEDKLSTLREKVSQEVGVGEEELNLSSTYPRKELTEDMDDGTLTQLGLVSAIIVVRFKRGSGRRGGGGGGGGKDDGGVFGWLLVLLTGLLGLLLSLVSLVKRILGCGDGPEKEGEGHRTYSASGGNNSNRSKRDYNERGGKNVHRILTADFDEESSDDEERRSTYNGNSTQQQ